MANYPECLLCDSKVSEVCGKLYVARGKKPPCAGHVVENCHSLQQLKAEIADLLSYVEDSIGSQVAISGRYLAERLRQLSAI